MRKNSRAKGSKFERDIAKVFQQWTGMKFSRTPLSGGWHKAVNAVGDLICTKEGHKFPFVIECKFHQDIRFEHLLLGNKRCKILDFWEQTKEEAKMADKHPILIMKYNGMGKQAFVIVKQEIGVILARLGMQPPTISIYTENGSDVLIVYILTNLIDIPYKKLKKEIKKLSEKGK